MRPLYLVGLSFTFLAGTALVVGLLQQTSSSRGACCVDDGCTSTGQATCVNVGGRWLKDQSCATDVCAIPATPAPTVPIVGDPCNITLIELELTVTNLECAGAETSLSSALVTAVDGRGPGCDPLEVTMECVYMIGFEPASDSNAFSDLEIIPIADFEWIDDYNRALTDAFNITGSEDIGTVTIRYKESDSIPGDMALYRCGISSDEWPIGVYGISPMFPKNLCL
jgi:hypothetical protein